MDSARTGEWSAGFISPAGERPRGPLRGWYLEREFEIDDSVVEATIRATALGVYELRVNGRPAGDQVMAPGWTNYDKRLLFQTCDVTSLLRPGVNRLVGHVGPGWYKGVLAWGIRRRNRFGDRVALSLELRLRFADGRERRILTDADWTSRPSPVRSSGIYSGEVWDARLEQGGSGPGLSRRYQSRGVKVLPPPAAVPIPQDGPLIRRQEVLPVREVLTDPSGRTVLDFGRLLTGRVRFRVTGCRGDRAVLRHAEVLDRHGGFYTKNLRRARQKITYILKGGDKERYEPCFTFQGFRYIQLSKWPGPVNPEDFEAVVIHSDLRATGTFRCSNELLNRLHENIRWSMKGNFLDIPTDCPQRDERLGWTGDAQAFIGTAVYLADVGPFFRKWLRDLASEQRDDGGVPHVIPDVISNPGRGGRPPGRNPFHSSAGWSDAAVICPWELYMAYGDLSILEENYPAASAWVDYVEKRAGSNRIWNGDFQYGDWLALDEKPGAVFSATPTDLVATAFFARSAELTARMAGLLGRKDDSRRYRQLHESISAAFRSHYLDAGGHLTARTQSAQVITLAFGLVRGEARDVVASDLVELIESAGRQLTTGFLATVYLLGVLDDIGRPDLAWALLVRTEYPSWLYPITLGATTVWERWDGIRPDGRFSSWTMNSFNHYAYGAVGRDLYAMVAGIRPAEAGYRRIILRPRPGGGLSFAEASLETRHGLIRSAWKISDGEMHLSVTVPEGTTAAVIRPLPGGRSLDNEELEVGPGDHSWTYAYREDPK